MDCKKIKYTSSPLPFIGQKRTWIKEIEDVVTNDFKNINIFVDLFGGSGLVSHTIKQARPDAIVIWNDYDNFRERLDNIEQTNEIIEKIRPFLLGKKKKERIDDATKKIIINILRESNPKDIITISTNLCFSGKVKATIAELQEGILWNNLLKNKYQADGYLEGVNRVSCDYRKLLDWFSLFQGVCFVADPPYFKTEASTYKGQADVIKCHQMIDILFKDNFIFFTSEKSQTIELYDFMCIERKIKNRRNFKIKEKQNRINYNSQYKDIMIFNKK